MMFGTREAFSYFKCYVCGCLQIAEIPNDLGRHYPDGYYSFHTSLPETPRISAWKAALKARRLDATLGNGGLPGSLLSTLAGPPELPAGIEDLGLRSSDRILDVGCGNGRFLALMRHAGFRHLSGIDPFMPSDHEEIEGIALHRTGIEAFDGEFDAIFIQHTLEHMPDQVGTLRHLRRLVAPGGRIVVRIPITGSPVESRYGTDWVQWDAPRHLFIHSTRSLRRLCADAGLMIARVTHDSSGFCVLGSERYRRGLRLMESDVGDDKLFSPYERALSGRIAARMNRMGLGDQATFVLVCRE